MHKKASEIVLAMCKVCDTNPFTFIMYMIFSYFKFKGIKPKIWFAGRDFKE